MPEFGDRLRRVRLANSLSLRDLAAMSGTTHAAISRWENGVHEPGASQIVAVASALGVTVSDLLGETSSNTVAELPMVRDGAGLYRTDPAAAMIPVIGWAHAGLPRTSDDWIDSYMPVRASDWSRTRWGTRIEGDCMEPDLREGDFVGIAECNPDDLQPANDIILARWDDQVVCRLWGGYIGTRPRMVSLVPRNTVYPVLSLPVRDVRVIGRVAWSHRDW